MRLSGPSSRKFNMGITPGVHQNKRVGFSQLVRSLHDTRVPSWQHGDVNYKSDESALENRNITYATIGVASFLAVNAARHTVYKFLDSMNAAADVLALSSIEVSLAEIPVGAGVTIKWRGKPVFIRHRTAAEIEAARADDTATLPHKQLDADRVQKPEWLIVLGVCTHLGCVPIHNAGAYKGFFCPCHGSHYDISGRIRLGPAPLNLDVPEYKFLTDDLVKIG